MQLDHWAEEHQLHRLELTVMESNTAGVALYQKNGFGIEGLKKRFAIRKWTIRERILYG
ncbi:GNAT family N-acetyltransferase [Sporosarcina sp. NPDC096371]|uniref:GNAT family N-acetyltransferase n=1 Tax=Sporosarcina sp. NPDC096371 TaxID=3364530 RepID=UPI003813B1A9